MLQVWAGLMIDGDQNFFPVYEPDADALKKKWLEAEEEARAHHDDSTKEGEPPFAHIPFGGVTTADPKFV